MNAAALGGGGISVGWPVEFAFDPMPGAYVVSPIPDFLTGEYSWTEGCCVAARDNVVAFTCGGDCGCGGCSAVGSFLYEGYALPVLNLGCGCPGGAPPGGPGTNAFQAALSVGLSLERNAVLFEDAYTNAPGDTVGRRSTFSAIALDFASGENAATVTLSVPSGAEKIRLHDGGTNGPAVAGWSTNLAPHASGSRVFYAEGVEASGAMRDVRLRAVIRDSVETALANRRMTSGKVEVYAVDPFPTNHHRHIFGPFETVKVNRYPHDLPLQLVGDLPFDGTLAASNNTMSIHVPSRVCAFSLDACFGDSVLDLPFRVIEPEEDFHVDHARLPTPLELFGIIGLDEPLRMGDIGAVLHIDMSLCPKTVSFMHILLLEGYAEAENIHGYFTNECFNGHLNHTVEAGAFYDVISVTNGNVIGSGDNLCFCPTQTNLPPVTAGEFTLHIPFHWFVEGGSVMKKINTFESRVSIYDNADVKVSKFGVSARRGTNNYTTIIQERR